MTIVDFKRLHQHNLNRAPGMRALMIGAYAVGAIRPPTAMLALALLLAMALPFLLPKMHERYLFLADILALTLALAVRSRSAILIAVAAQLTSLAALISYIHNWPVPALAGSLVGVAALVMIWKQARAKNPNECP